MKRGRRYQCYGRFAPNLFDRFTAKRLSNQNWQRDVAGTIYEKYGGFKAVSRVVMDFYNVALDSDQIGDHFEHVDMPRLVDHQTKFISSLLGGPASFSDDHLRQVHLRLNISHDDFDEMKQLLGETLDRHGFSDEDVNTVLVEIETKRTLIVAAAAA